MGRFGSSSWKVQLGGVAPEEMPAGSHQCCYGPWRRVGRRFLQITGLVERSNGRAQTRTCPIASLATVRRQDHRRGAFADPAGLNGAVVA